MKNFIAVGLVCLAGLFVQAQTAQAQDQVVVSTQKTVTFKCVKPADVVKGVACYTVNVSKAVLKGAGKIVSAPFKTKICLPKLRTYKWERGHWVPSRLYEVPELRIEDGERSNLQYLPHYDPKDGKFITVNKF
tara:strand:- start:1586 stop:1984 length:399 start_codon:yes stop_codon:yes gene_type:complete